MTTTDQNSQSQSGQTVIINQVEKKKNGIGNVLCMIASIPDDPLVYLIHQTKPDWIPVKEYQFFVFSGFIAVYKDQLPKRNNESPLAERLEGYPFEGDIAAEKETTILGFRYPVESVIFTIDKEWNVITNGKHFGYIDIDGNIRKGLKGDPKATLAGGTLIGKVRGGRFYN